MDCRHPFPHTLLFPFAVHDAGTAATPKKGIAIVFIRCLAKVGDLFSGGDVMCPNQGVEESHLGGAYAQIRKDGNSTPAAAFFRVIRRVKSALSFAREAFTFAGGDAKLEQKGHVHTRPDAKPHLHPTRPGSPLPGCTPPCLCSRPNIESFWL